MYINVNTIVTYDKILDKRPKGFTYIPGGVKKNIFMKIIDVPSHVLVENRYDEYELSLEEFNNEYGEAMEIREDDNGRKVIYYKPYIRLKLSNGEVYDIYFDSKEELEEWERSNLDFPKIDV